MSNKKLTDLTPLTTIADGDKVYIVDVSDTTDSTAGTSKYILKSDLVTDLEPADITGVTASVAEINILDGATLSTAELNILDGVTASTEDINATTNFEETISATTSEVTIATSKTLNVADDSGLKLNETAVTSTAAELNQLDGVTVGGTSSGDIVDLDTAQTLTNKTLSTGTALDANADPNFTYYGTTRQAIINGNFDVAQYRPSAAVTIADTTKTFVSDRWHDYVDPDGGTSPTLTRQRLRLTPGDIDKSYWYTRLTFDGAGSSLGTSAIHYHRQNIWNGTRQLAGASRYLSLSFWARSDVVGKKLGSYYVQTYGSGGTPTAAENINGEVFNLTTSWAKYTKIITLNTLSGKTFGTSHNDHFDIALVPMWGTDFDTLVGGSGGEDYVGAGYIDIAQVQATSGQIILPFQPKPSDVEVTDCQRFYHHGFNYTENPPGITTTASRCPHWEAYSTSILVGTLSFPVEMIGTPSITVYSPFNGNANKVETVTNSEVGTTVTATGITAKGFYQLNDSGTGFTADEQYQFQYIADAEI